MKTIIILSLIAFPVLAQSNGCIIPSQEKGKPCIIPQPKPAPDPPKPEPKPEAPKPEAPKPK